MMNKIKCFVMLLGIILPAAYGLAHSELTTEKDGGNPVIINKGFTNGQDRSDSISASIDGHCLTVVFLSNLGQVSIKILNEYGVTIDCMTTPTPNGYLCYITSAGHYTVVFTLPDGDEYYGEFDVTD